MRTRLQDRLVGDAWTIGFACVGGFLGYLVFQLVVDRGFYALAVPGGLLGLTAAIPRSRSPIVPVVCGVLAIVAGLVTEHRYAPFVADGRFTFFVANAMDLRTETLVLIGLGGLIGFWFPFRRRIRGAQQSVAADERRA